MKILYGVTGEGMGHAVRSSVLLEHLVASGHEVAVVASSRAYSFLSRRFAGEPRAIVKDIHGLFMRFDGNRLDVPKTLYANAVTGLRSLPRNIAAYFDLEGQFRPDAVISDFDSWSWLYAFNHRLPLLSIDNMQILDRCDLPDVVRNRRGVRLDFHLARAFVKSKLPLCDRYFITTFFRPPIRKERTRLFPPILRREILEAAKRRSRGDHILVYPAAGGHPELLRALHGIGLECRFYGNKSITEERVTDNLRERPFSDAAFIEDLATCRAVIAGGGFTLMGEALSLKKPMLAVPIEGQFEQTLNAHYLELEGFGTFTSRPDKRIVRRFVDGLSRFDEALADYEQRGNEEILEGLDDWLDEVSAKRRGRTDVVDTAA